MKLSSSSLLFVSLILFSAFHSFRPVSAVCHPDDEAGLLGFKSAITHDPSGILSSWKPGTDCCYNWEGVDCDSATNRVTTISIYCNPDEPKEILSGTISPSLEKVHHLGSILLQNPRNITGKFPDVFFRLPNLRYIVVQNSRLSGQIPSNIGTLTQLSQLNLTGNHFTGSIPSSISQLAELIKLDLGGNFLTGVIPDGIRQLKKLNEISLHHNQLSGTIPDFFSSFPDLSRLDLSHNKFHGQIPASLSSLGSMMFYLNLGHNRLSGQIPDFLGKFGELDTLDLSWNNLTGVVPKRLGNLTRTYNIDLSHNSLMGSFPELKVRGIQSLDLSYNQLNLKQIPNWVTSSPLVHTLRLAKCGIKMNLNDWKPMLPRFYEYIDLSHNEIAGSPVWLLNQTTNLVGFWASGNKLQFDMERLRFANTTKHLDLSRNLVYGKVPKTVSGLESLNVSYNHLCGKIPPTKFPATAFIGNDCLCGSPLPGCKA